MGWAAYLLQVPLHYDSGGCCLHSPTICSTVLVVLLCSGDSYGLSGVVTVPGPVSTLHYTPAHTLTPSTLPACLTCLHCLPCTCTFLRACLPRAAPAFRRYPAYWQHIAFSDQPVPGAQQKRAARNSWQAAAALVAAPAARNSSGVRQRRMYRNLARRRQQRVALGWRRCFVAAVSPAGGSGDITSACRAWRQRRCGVVAYA